MRTSNSIVRTGAIVLTSKIGSVLTRGLKVTGHIGPASITINIGRLVRLPGSMVRSHFRLRNGRNTTYLFTKSPASNLVNNNFLCAGRGALSLKLIYNLRRLRSTGGSIPRVLRSFGRRPTITPLVTNNGLIRCSTRMIPRTNVGVLPRLINSNMLVTNSTTKVYVGLNFAVHNVSLTVTTKRTTTGAILSTVGDSSFDGRGLTRCHRRLRDNPLHSVHVCRGLPTFLSGPHVFDNCPRLTINITHSLFAVSNDTPRLVHGGVLHRNGGINFVGLVGSNVGKIAIL